MSTALKSGLSDAQLRDRLAEMVIKDLLGPAGGEHEEVYERTVRGRYLVGVLAPSRQSGVARAAPEEDEEDEGESEAPLDQLAEGGTDSLEEGSTELDVPVVHARLPSSFGMTFCVDESAKSIVVHAQWGQYKRESREDQIDQRTGRPIRVWKRYPRGGKKELKLKPGVIKPLVLDGESPDVFVQGQIRKRNTLFFVTLFLVNGQEERRPKDESYVFQPELAVTAPDGAAVFTQNIHLQRTRSGELEEETMAMLYRHCVEFAVGHGVSVHAEVSRECPQRAVMIRTQVVPRYEVPKATPPSEHDAELNPAFAELRGLVCDMRELANTEDGRFGDRLGPLVRAYRRWIDGEAAKLDDPSQDLSQFREVAQANLAHCRQTLGRIEEGLQLIDEDPTAAEAFRFMNRAMWLQRTHSIYSERVRRGEEVDFDSQVDVPENRTWYPFQIAFILLSLPGVTKLDHPDRSTSQEATADLLFFPTGGGKTEAYLGLAAYTMALRRLQGMVGGRDGEHGVAVLMRYTLRVLTIQQFQRAAALMCACEVIRRNALEQGDSRWGRTPLRIGLWVGRRTTPNRTDDALEAVKQARGTGNYASTGMGSPYQLTNCPWCGSRIDIGKHLEVQPYKQGSCRTIVYCGDRFGSCPFSKRQAEGEGLPVVVVDEEIYRRLPSLLIATVDKFAQMPWKGEVQMLFGQVSGHCQRHGFISPEIEDLAPGSQHPGRRGVTAPAKVTSTPLLRPPDLIIQDELHLISGPLGSLVGLYETAIDQLCTWEVDGRQVRPKLVASTATVKNAAAQIYKLFLRRVNLFPPHGLGVRDNFFAIRRELGDEHPGRMYLGICAPGRRVKAALIRVYVAFLCAAQALFEKEGLGAAVDPWMTLVGYFNSIRELGGMRRLVDDDVYSRVIKMDRRGLAKRSLGTDYLRELTSRIRSEEIPFILDRLEARFDPQRGKHGKPRGRKPGENHAARPLDVLLATNMISVGVDVQRLGLMVVAGQPKATAEYIQATSRVGRRKPGIVCTVFNWARPRDLSHYETFEHYHATFYKHVEPLSVTPFSPGSLHRGLAGLLVTLVRLRGTEFNPNHAAARIQLADPYVEGAIAKIAARAELVADHPETAQSCRAQLLSKFDLWKAEAQNVTGGRSLFYTLPWGPDRGTAVSLLSHPGLEIWHEFTCLDSLRDVEPTVKLIVHDGGLDEKQETLADG